MLASAIPDLLILDTKSAVLKYQSAIIGVDAMGLFPMVDWGRDIVEAVGIVSDIDYSLARLQYEIAADFIVDGRDGAAETICKAIHDLINEVHAQLQQCNVYDERGFSHYTFHSWIAGEDLVLQYYSLG